MNLTIQDIKKALDNIPDPKECPADEQRLVYCEGGIFYTVFFEKRRKLNQTHWFLKKITQRSPSI